MKNRENVFKSSPNVCGVGAIKTVSNLATLALSINGLRKKEYAAEDSLILSVRDLTNLGLQIAQRLLTRRMREGSGAAAKQEFLEKINSFYKNIENHKKIETFLQNLNVKNGNVYDFRKNIKSKKIWNQYYNKGYNYTIFDSIYENINDTAEASKSNKIQTLLDKYVYINTCKRVEDLKSEKIFNLNEFTMLSIPLKEKLNINNVFNLFNNIFDQKFDINNVFYIGDVNPKLENLYYLENNFWSYPGNTALLPSELRKPTKLTTIYCQLAGSKEDRDNTFNGITKEKLESLNDKNFIEIGELTENSVTFGFERLIFAALNDQ